jgi:hypothetical protein
MKAGRKKTWEMMGDRSFVRKEKRWTMEETGREIGSLMGIKSRQRREGRGTIG